MKGHMGDPWIPTRALGWTRSLTRERKVCLCGQYSQLVGLYLFTFTPSESLVRFLVKLRVIFNSARPLLYAGKRVRVAGLLGALGPVGHR